MKTITVSSLSLWHHCPVDQIMIYDPPARAQNLELRLAPTTSMLGNTIIISCLHVHPRLAINARMALAPAGPVACIKLLQITFWINILGIIGWWQTLYVTIHGKTNHIVHFEITKYGLWKKFEVSSPYSFGCMSQNVPGSPVCYKKWVFTYNSGSDFWPQSSHQAWFLVKVKQSRESSRSDEVVKTQK